MVWEGVATIQALRAGAGGSVEAPKVERERARGRSRRERGQDRDPQPCPRSTSSPTSSAGPVLAKVVQRLLLRAARARRAQAPRTRRDMTKKN